MKLDLLIEISLKEPPKYGFQCLLLKLEKFLAFH
jgi:hypothetical protein